MKGFIEVTYFNREGTYNGDEIIKTRLIPVSEIKCIERFAYSNRLLNSQGFYDEPECLVMTDVLIYPQESYEKIKALIKLATEV